VAQEIGSVAQAEPSGAEGFWPKGWWAIVDFKIGIIPLPIFVILIGVIGGFAATGSVPSDILMAIVLLSMGGFACAELGKRIPIIRNVGAAAIFATFIPSYLAFHHLLPASILNSVTQFTKDSNFLYLFIACIIVGSILGMDRGVLIKGFLKIFIPLACASVVATIDAMRDEGIVENAATIGQQIIGPGLRELAQRHPVIGEVRGLGAFWALDLVSDRATRAMLAPYGSSSEAMGVLMSEAKSRGLLTFTNYNRLHVVPPCIVTAEQAKEGLAILDEVLTVVDGFYTGG